MEPDFSGWASKVGIRCTDGRTIQKGAFKHQDGAKVPLVYMHNHKDSKQVLGFAILKHADEGVWADLFFSDTYEAEKAKKDIKHGAIDKLSIWAKDVEEQVANREILVHDGVIQEVSLVLAGANAGAMLMNVLSHGNLDADDNLMVVTGDIVATDGTEIKHSDEPPANDDKSDLDKGTPGDTTVQDILATLTDDQMTAVNGVIEGIVNESVTEALTEAASLQHDDLQKGNDMNAFEKHKGTGGAALPQLKHSSVEQILINAKGNPEGGLKDVNQAQATGSLRSLIRNGAGKDILHADNYGLQNIEILFPDAQAVMARPTWVDRRQEWVKVFLGGTSHSPFSRIKTMHADITADEARARGYFRGNRKVDEVFPIFKRTTGPAWIYKRQRLDRQDIIDIVDFDVVAWMKAEMRGKLDEEIARAGLLGDGRPVMIGGEMNKDKIAEPTGNEGNGIRSVINDDDLYSTTYNVSLAEDATGQAWNALLDAAVLANEYYLGSGNKTAFVSYRTATKLLTIRDDWGHRIYRNLSEVAGDMDVSQIVRVPTELFPADVLAITLDLSDYNFGTNRGGDVTLFDDFDIDFNQFIYLIETYLSGALTLPFSAQVFRRVDPAGTLVDAIPAPQKDANVVTIPTSTEVNYRQVNSDGTYTARAGGYTTTLNDTNNKTVTFEAVPKDGYYFESNSDNKDTFSFRYVKPAE